MLPYIIKSDSLSLFPFGQAPIVIAGDHINFNAVVDALKSGDYDLAIELASVSSYLNTITGGDVSVDDSGVYYKGNPLNDYLAGKLHTFFTQGLPVQHYCLFISNLMANPSMVSRKELFLFLEAANLPITEDGCFLAYKAVRSDFKDIHSGKFDNSPGVTHTMPRAEVDDDRNQTCSYGFHASAYEYAQNFMTGNGHLVAVKINPADVVSVPSDYNNQKLRTCSYTVLFEIEGAKDIFKGQDYYDGGEPSYQEDTNTYMWGSFYESDDGDEDEDF